MILLVGSTGRIGTELARLLGERNVPVRALVRNPDAARVVLGPEVALVHGDLGDPRTLPAALDGATSVFLLSPNEPDQVRLQRNLWQAARSAGVERLVKLSGTRPSDDPTRSVGHWHHVTEREIRESGLAYTFLQPNFFMQNFLLYAADMTDRGVLETPTGAGRVSCVDLRDVAACAAAVLTGGGHEGATYVLTGGSALRVSDVAEAFGAALGWPVRHRHVDEAAARARLLAAGLPGWLVTYVLSLYASFESGEAATVTGHVRRLTGRDPKTIDECAQAYIARRAA